MYRMSHLIHMIQYPSMSALKIEYTVPAGQVRLKFGDILRDRKYSRQTYMVINQQQRGRHAIVLYMWEPWIGETMQIDAYALAGLDLVRQDGLF